jgi:hypothetical protein
MIYFAIRKYILSCQECYVFKQEQNVLYPQEWYPPLLEKIPITLLRNDLSTIMKVNYS